MTLLLIGFLAAAQAAGPSAPVTNIAQNAGAIGVIRQASNGDADKEFQKLQAADDAAQAEVSKWISENDKLKAKGGGAPEVELKQRIGERLEPIQRAYKEFLEHHPGHAEAHLAYGVFLNERNDEAGAQAQWEKAVELDPKNAAAYNNLAGIYSEGSNVKKAFEFFTKAIELSPSEAAYYHNFGDSLYVQRKRAMELYGISEQEVYAKSLRLYSNAVRLDPLNFAFAWDLAQTYYAFNPLPSEEALKAWTNALKSAQNQLDREGVYVHLARLKMLASRHSESRAQLSNVVSTNFSELKTRLLRAIEEREKTSPATNTAPVSKDKQP